MNTWCGRSESEEELLLDKWIRDVRNDRWHRIFRTSRNWECSFDQLKSIRCLCCEIMMRKPTANKSNSIENFQSINTRFLLFKSSNKQTYQMENDLLNQIDYKETPEFQNSPKNTRFSIDLNADIVLCTHNRLLW